jgi:hypothetical protein
MPNHLQRVKNGTWRVRVGVPPRLAPVIGKANFTYPLGTKDEGEAASRANSIIQDFQARIAEAEHELCPTPGASWASRRWFYLDDDPFFNHSHRGSPPPISLVPVFGDRGELMGYRQRKQNDPPKIIVSMARVWSDSRSENIDKRTWIGIVGKIKRLSDHFEQFNPFHITADDLSSYPTALLSEGLKPSTVDDHLVYIKAVFEQIKNACLIDINPAENLTQRSLVSRLNVKKIRAERDTALVGIENKIEQEADPVLIRLYRAEYAFRHAEFAALLAPPHKRSEAIAKRIRASVRYQEMNAEAIAIKLMSTT